MNKSQPKKPSAPSVVPEYIRLNKNPIPIMQVKQEEQVRQREFQMGAKEKMAQNKLNIPRQLKLSGKAEDYWVPADNGTPTPHVSTPQLEEESVKINSTPVFEEEIELPLESEEVEESFMTSPPDDPINKLSLLNSGEFCIMYNGDIISIQRTLTELEEAIDFIIFSADCPIKDVTLDQLSVFKKMNLRAGVLVHD